MKDLSPLAQQLVKAGKKAYQPADADKIRIREALNQHLPNSPQSPQAPNVPPQAPAVPRVVRWPVVSSAALGTAVVAGALYLGLSSEPKSPDQQKTPAVVVPRAHEQPAAPKSPHIDRTPTPGSGIAAPPAVEPMATKEVGPQPKTSEEVRRKNRLAEEVALLSKATSALNAGRAEDALKTLAEHERKFPRGVLTVERRAARAQALCLLGRKAEAERELQRLSPASPQANRARQLCRGK